MVEFDAFPRSVKRGILEWIANAKRPEARAKRIAETARLAADNIRANQWRQLGAASMSTPGNDHTEQVSWKVDDIDVEAALTRPRGDGPFPAIVLVAGSGPTDRNWNSPLIPGANGSAALLAHVLTAQNFITLRYDKRASGPHLRENMSRLLGKISMQGHREELAGGVRLLASQTDVDPKRLFALTSSEGCIHALNYQLRATDFPLAGLILTGALDR
jgi:hypothetical protein